MDAFKNIVKYGDLVELSKKTPTGRATSILAGVICTFIPRDEYTYRRFWHLAYIPSDQ